MRELFLDGCPDVDSVEDRRGAIAAQGYRLLGGFVLPPAGWWENYHVPLGRCLERFRGAHAGDAEALDVALGCQKEIDLCRKHAGTFGYVFFALRREGGGGPP